MNLDGMAIFIPTYGRVNKQHTMRALSEELQKHVIFVCNKQEAPELRRLWPMAKALVCPDTIKDIGTKKQWITEVCHKNGVHKALMIDDDIGRLEVRRNRVDAKMYKARRATDDEQHTLFEDIARMLDHFPVVGVTPKGGSNHHDKEYKDWPVGFHKRIYSFYAIDVEIFIKENVRWDEMTVMEDMNACLHLLRKGYMTALITDRNWANGPVGSDGGCSEYRDLYLQRDCANQLAETHAPFVKTRIAETKASWVGKDIPEEFIVMKPDKKTGEEIPYVRRTDVTCYWKKAYVSAAGEPDYKKLMFLALGKTLDEYKNEMEHVSENYSV